MAGRMSGEARADEARVTAWLALSEFFLDTEHDDRDIARIGAALAGTGFDIAELEKITKTKSRPCAGATLAVCRAAHGRVLIANGWFKPSRHTARRLIWWNMCQS